MGLQNVPACVRRTVGVPTTTQVPDMEPALKAVQNILPKLEARIIEFLSEWPVTFLMPAGSSQRETLVSQVLSDYPRNAGFANGLFVMTTATDHKNHNSSTLKKNYSCPSGRHKPQSFIETKTLRFCNLDTKNFKK